MSNTIVQTINGQLQGVLEGGVKVWRGIPYAEPPVGELRYQAPQRLQGWNGIRDASQYGPACLQPVDAAGSVMFADASKEDPSEDCLYLNVWAPEAESSQLRPVMVWIHGGAFVSGSGSMPMYDGTELSLRGDVVVVTINYRLGAFGFLHLTSFDDSFDSNVGLLDQVLALKWVRDNISAFGGDPERVTVFGESAGSMSIASLMAMPAAKGLFKQAIMESGASQVISTSQSLQITTAFLHELGIAQGEVSKLRTIPAARILEASQSLMHRMGGLGMLFQPTIDPATLPVEPARAIQDGSSAEVSLIIGTNRDEGAFFIREGSTPLDTKQAAVALIELTGSKEAGELVASYPSTTEGQAQLMTDLVFWAPSIRFATAQASHAPVWMYRFDWTLPGHPFFNKAVHGVEVLYVFNNSSFLSRLGVQPTEEVTSFAEKVQDAWIAFAHTGSPATSDIPWPNYDTEKRSTLILDSKPHLIFDPDQEKRRML